jgi:hypothetical protein
MKPRTRDNIIYLAVGLGVAALLVADVFYADSRGREAWFPSKFAFRSAYTTVLIWFVVLKGIRALRQTFVQVLARVLFATLMHLAIFIASRQIIEQLPGIGFSVVCPWEMYFVVLVTDAGVPYFIRTARRHSLFKSR